MTDELVTKAFAKALAGCNVKRETIIHTDRGSHYVSKNFHYVSKNFWVLLEANECRQSM